MEQAKESAPAAPKAVKAKTSKTVVAGMAICAAFAIAGAVFSGYALMKMSDNTKTTNTSTTTATKATVSNEVATNLIAPYIRSQTYLANIFDIDFDDNNKFAIAVQNLDPAVTPIYNNYIDYESVNRSAQTLFGTSYTLPKKDYAFGGWQFKLKDDSNYPTFDAQLYGIGGAGLQMINAVKSAYYDGDDIIVEVYHEVVPLCEFLEEDAEEHCYKTVDTDGTSYYTYEEELKGKAEHVEKYGDEIPVYQMTFTLDKDHYVLKDVEKQ